MFRKEKPFEDKYPYSTRSIIRYCLHILICCKTELSRNCCPFSWVSCKTEVRISKELFSFLRECFIAMHFLWWPSNYVTKNLNILYIQMRIWGKPHDMYNLVYIHVSKSFLRICLLFFSVFEEPEDPTNRSFFSEIISSISDVKFSNSGRYMISRDYLSVKVWDLHMETKPIETYTVRLFFWMT